MKTSLTEEPLPNPFEQVDSDRIRIDQLEHRVAAVEQINDLLVSCLTMAMQGINKQK